jgi:hypothetical protein
MRYQEQVSAALTELESPNPILEGTTGIHGIDLVSRKIRRDGGAAFAVLRETIQRSLSQAAARPALEFGAGAVAEAFKHLCISVDRLIAEAEEHRALANASAFLSALGHSVVGWLWLDQALACDKAIAAGAGPADLSFYSGGKIRAFTYFAEAELPRVAVWVSQVNAMSDVAASMPIEEF